MWVGTKDKNLKCFKHENFLASASLNRPENGSPTKMKCLENRYVRVFPITLTSARFQSHFGRFRARVQEIVHKA